ncbi:hypothetical protein B0T18DRAFT_395714 [Schizothecium vesticola]|uniref:Antifreeze protein n=1 Tax=Schizothecium vesticola TaxID=314040 RepID=A0AA40F8H2_9PEZI|nr:hypothetical protein B0T18DRAFT_395714 [Schizothecium vesticola]
MDPAIFYSDVMIITPSPTTSSPDNTMPSLRLLVAASLAATIKAQVIDLGTALPFAVLAGEAVTNTGLTTVDGHLGVSPGTSISGFLPGTVTTPSTKHSADAVALQAKLDLVTAYDSAAGRLSTPLTGVLGGRTLAAGVYSFNSSAQLTGPLTLDAQNNMHSVWIFQTGSSLTTASSSSVTLVNGASACNVFWQIGSSATLGTNSVFVGSILALKSITASTGATVNGGLYARNGAVTLDSNGVRRQACAGTPASSIARR